MNYKVTYEIEIEADSFKDAAEQAWAIMLDPASYPPVLDVEGESGQTYRVDCSNGHVELLSES